MQVKVLATELSHEQSADLQKIRTAFGMIESVDMVHSHVSAAVKRCNDQFPDMTGEVQPPFEVWERRVLPVAKHNKEILDKAIHDGRFDEPGLITDYLETIDKAAEFTDARLVKNPVTNERTCEGLAASMNNTKEELVSLLNDIEWPEGVEVTPLPDPTELVDHEETTEEVAPDAPEEAVQTDANEASEESEAVVEEKPAEPEEAVEEVSEEEPEAEAVPSLEDLAKEAEALTNDVENFSDSADEVLEELVDPAENKVDASEIDVETVVEELSVSEEDIKKSVEEMEQENREKSMKSENELMEMEIKQQLDSTDAE